MPESQRIFFDTNEGSHEQGYSLILPQSKLDLEALGTELREGVIVTLHMPAELEVLAMLRFDPDDEVWVGHPIGKSIRFIDQG